MNKIEQLIEKWKLKRKDLHNVGCPIDGYYMYVAEIIKDLQSIQEPTEEREEFDHLGCDHASGLCFE